MENSSFRTRDLGLLVAGSGSLTLGAVGAVQDLQAGLPDSYSLAPAVSTILFGGLIISKVVCDLYARRQHNREETTRLNAAFKAWWEKPYIPRRKRVDLL